MRRHFGAALLLLAACSPRAGGLAAGSSATSAATPPQPDSVLITLERTPCFGSCPVYAISVSGAGQVRFVGRRFTAHEGEASDSVPPERVDSLVEELRAGGYFGFADAYVHGAPSCGRYATDSPTVITSVTVNGERKEIRHDYGCGGAPPELAALELRIDEVTGSARWTTR